MDVSFIWVYDPCKTPQLTSKCIGQKENKEQSSHLNFGQKGKTIGFYCSFYTEHEPFHASVLL